MAPNKATTNYVYDGFGRLIQRSSPDTGTTVYTYDLGDNLTQSHDASGVVVSQTYDALNRPTSTTYPADASENVIYIYDQPGHGFGVGRLTGFTDAVGSLSLTYDERGNRAQRNPCQRHGQPVHKLRLRCGFTAGGHRVSLWHNRQLHARQGRTGLCYRSNPRGNNNRSPRSIECVVLGIRTALLLGLWKWADRSAHLRSILPGKVSRYWVGAGPNL